jgi:hypothetical protein
VQGDVRDARCNVREQQDETGCGDSEIGIRCSKLHFSFGWGVCCEKRSEERGSDTDGPLIGIEIVQMRETRNEESEKGKGNRRCFETQPCRQESRGMTRCKGVWGAHGAGRNKSSASAARRERGPHGAVYRDVQAPRASVVRIGKGQVMTQDKRKVDRDKNRGQKRREESV